MAGLSDRERRAAMRREWPIVTYSLGDETGDDLSSVTTAEERLAMMWELACSAWIFSGRPFPEYDRSEIPGRVLRR